VTSKTNWNILPLLLLCKVCIHGLVYVENSLLPLFGEFGEDVQVLLPLSTRVSHHRSKLEGQLSIHQSIHQSIKQATTNQLITGVLKQDLWDDGLMTVPKDNRLGMTGGGGGVRKC